MISNEDAQEIIERLKKDSVGSDCRRIIDLYNAKAAVWNQIREDQRPPWSKQ